MSSSVCHITFLQISLWCGLAKRLTRIRLSLRQTPTVQVVFVRHAYAVPAALTSHEQYMAACCLRGNFLRRSLGGTSSER